MNTTGINKAFTEWLRNTFGLRWYWTVQKIKKGWWVK